MKKYLIMAISCLFILGFSIGLTACGNGEHEHSVSNWTVTVNATCSTEGSREGLCDICGEKQVEAIEKLPHAFGDWIVTKEASCTQEGSRKKVCSVGGEEITEVIAKLPHQFCDWLVTKGATCIEEGSQEHTCQVCGLLQSEILPKTEHVPYTTQVRVEPKCEQVGWTEELKCSVCQTTLQERAQIPALEHQYGQWQTLEPATCHKNGEQVRTCELCQHPDIQIINQLEHKWLAWEYDEEKDNHKHSCELCGDVQDFACNYPEGDPIVVPATCETDGKEYKICSVCEHEKVTEILEKTGHAYEFISITVEETVQGHSHQHYERCSKCGDTKDPVDCVLHDDGAPIPATCITPEYQNQKCDKCGAIHEVIKNEANGHEWIYDAVTAYPSARHNKHCKNCDTPTVNEACSLTSERHAADCNNGASTTYTCNECHNFRTISEAGGKPLGHNWGPWTFTGTSKEDATHQRTCLREDCHETQNGSCHLVSTTTHPTCIDAGKVDYVCDECDETFTEEGSAAEGHQWQVLWRVDAESGMHYRVCDKCGEHETPQPHNYDETEILPTCGQDGKLTKRCQQCGDVVEEIKPATALKHNWTLSSIQDGKHIAQCANCHAYADGEHDFSESNLCSVCGYDGLKYKIDGKHATVLKSENVKNAKEIIIGPYCKQLDAEGHYKVTEYEVAAIGENAFMNYDNIIHVTLPYTLTTIGEAAFNDCTHLQTVTLDCNDVDKIARLKDIKRMAFYHCTALQTFNPPKTLESIGTLAFAHCKTLHTITIPDAVEDIEQDAFLDTNFTNDSSHWVNGALYLGKHLIKVKNEKDEEGGLNTTFVVKDETLTIAANAFELCTQLQNLTLPDSLIRIDRDAFKNCNNISSVTFTGTIGQWLGIVFINDLSSPLCNSNTGLSIEHADGVVDLTNPTYTNGRTITHIPAGTFRGTDITSVILPDTVTYIGEEAFENCSQLESITFPNGCKVTYVGKDVLKGSKYYSMDEHWENGKVLYIDGKILVEADTSLEGDYSVKPETVVVVARAFEGCENVTNITIEANIVYIGEHAFDGCTKTKLTFTDDSYYWMCDSPLLGISRSMSEEDLSINTYRTYYGAWKRLPKAAPKETANAVSF